MKAVKVGLIGYGTIGSGVHALVEQKRKLIGERRGLDLQITAICDTRIDSITERTSDITYTDRWEDIVNNPDIDFVVELIGGIDPAREIVISALKNGKDVVTANKKLLAEAGKDIFATADSLKRPVGFEAAIGGGIPCLLALTTGLVGNHIRSIMGILNGTTNYILSQMEEKGLAFDTILKDAQDKGFAEADPTFDIEGYDAGHKIALLASLAYQCEVDFSSIPIEGITKITDIDIAYAKDMGYAIKLLGIARMEDAGLDISVHPTMIPAHHPLAAVRNEFNAVMYDGDMTDPVILHGKGAGSLPTASAVVSDIVQIAQSGKTDAPAFNISGSTTFLRAEDRHSKYYLRIHSKDEPGILSQISGVLGEHNISIASVIQKEAAEEYIPLIIMTHRIDEAAILAATEEISGFDFVKGEVMIIRVEDSNF